VEGWNPGAAIVTRGIETPQEFLDRPSYPCRAVRHSYSLSSSEPGILLNKPVSGDTKEKEFDIRRFHATLYGLQLNCANWLAAMCKQSAELFA